MDLASRLLPFSSHPSWSGSQKGARNKKKRHRSEINVVLQFACRPTYLQCVNVWVEFFCGGVDFDNPGPGWYCPGKQSEAETVVEKGANGGDVPNLRCDCQYSLCKAGIPTMYVESHGLRHQLLFHFEEALRPDFVTELSIFLFYPRGIVIPLPPNMSPVRPTKILLRQTF